MVVVCHRTRGFSVARVLSNTRGHVRPRAMSAESTTITAPAWRAELPVLSGRLVTLREPTTQDLGPLVALLSIRDATRFGLDEPVSDIAVQELIDRFARERA